MTSMTSHARLPVRGDPHRRLLRALIAMAGGEGRAAIACATHGPWASATFQGSRHIVRLTLIGPDARTRAQALRESLPEAEFTLPGHIVASLCIDALRDDADGTVALDLSALTIEDW